MSERSTSTPDPAAEPESDAARLARQVEDGHLFLHTALGESFARLDETVVLLQGLLDLLQAKGVIAIDEYNAAVAAARRTLTDQGLLSGPGTIIRVDEPTAVAQAAVEVDCAARMPVCQAICCKLNFALSVAEIEAGRVKWDLGQPYLIRHDTTGFCTHNDRSTGGCRVYADRPTICRRYSCANDGRIWSDFEAMVLNTAWIETHLAPNQPRRIGALMRVDDYLASRDDRPADLPDGSGY